MTDSEDKKDESLEEISEEQESEEQEPGSEEEDLQSDEEEPESRAHSEAEEDEESGGHVLEISDALADTGATPLDAPVLADKLGLFGKIDRGVFKVEVVVVVTALVVMSIVVFTDVVYQLMVAISQYLNAGDPQGYTLSGILLAFVGAMAWSASGAGETQRSIGFRAAVTAATLLGTAALGYSLLHLESKTIYRFLLLAHVVPVGLHFHRQEEKKRLGVLVASTLLALVLFGQLPTGYSWAQSYSLLLLLWVGFLGASMAARQRRHLRVDLARKLLTPEKLPWFNAASYTAAAIFSAVVLYLGYIYMFGPDSTYIRPIWDAPSWLPEGLRQTLMSDFPLPDDTPLWRRSLQVLFAPSEPGEIPDWLKVMAIPVSFLFITIRFLGHAFTFARMGMRGESFSEQMGVH